MNTLKSIYIWQPVGKDSDKVTCTQTDTYQVLISKIMWEKKPLIYQMIFFSEESLRRSENSEEKYNVWEKLSIYLIRN